MHKVARLSILLFTNLFWNSCFVINGVNEQFKVHPKGTTDSCQPPLTVHQSCIWANASANEAVLIENKQYGHEIAHLMLFHNHVHSFNIQIQISLILNYYKNITNVRNLGLNKNYNSTSFQVSWEVTNLDNTLAWISCRIIYEL